MPVAQAMRFRLSTTAIRASVLYVAEFLPVRLVAAPPRLRKLRYLAISISPFRSSPLRAPGTARPRFQLRRLRSVASQLHELCDCALELRVAAGRVIVRSVFGLDVRLGAHRRAPSDLLGRRRTCAVWDREVIGPGYFFRQQHELLLLAARGSPPGPAPSDRAASVIRSRRGVHSEKPKLVYELIERMYPALPKLELFARGRREGWSARGNQAAT